MTEIETITLEAELTAEAAEREIETAVKGRHAIARKYVKWVRGRHSDATPEEIVRLLERHYLVAISVAGGVVAAGTVALTVATARKPGGGLARKGVQQVGKRLLPAGDEQLQFEITALYAFALADIHDMTLDQSQGRALIYGLSNANVDQEQIAVMATEIAHSPAIPSQAGGNTLARHGGAPWAHTLAGLLPTGAQELLRGVQTGRLENVRLNTGAKQGAAVNYGVSALTGGVTRFVFGRGVIDASRKAFAAPPDRFPAHLAAQVKDEQEKDDAPNKALAALKDASHSVGHWVSDATRVFRSEDRDGDGIPDEPQALTAVKDASGRIANAAGAVVSNVSAPFKRKKNADHPSDSDSQS